MPRTIWSGAISFGLVTIPIRVASATENHSIQFHQYHLEDMGSPGVQPVAVVGRSGLMQLSADVPELIHGYRCGAIARSGDASRSGLCRGVNSLRSRDLYRDQQQALR